MAVCNPDTIITYDDVNVPCYLPRRQHYWTFYTLSDCHYHCLNILEFTEGGHSPLPLTPLIKDVEDQNSLVWIE